MAAVTLAASPSARTRETAPAGIAGERRSFWVCLALYLVTGGLYAYHWHYKVYDELRRQFDLGPYEG